MDNVGPTQCQITTQNETSGKHPNGLLIYFFLMERVEMIVTSTVVGVVPVNAVVS